MSDPSHEVETPTAPAAKRLSPSLVVALLVLGLAATGLVSWYVAQRETPTVVVQKFCSAMKGDRWEQAYDLIDWPEGKHVDEKTFISQCKLMRAMFSIQKYTLREPKREGSTAVVPVDVTLSMSSFTGTVERGGTIDVNCRYVDGQWKVRPDMQQILKLANLKLPGR